MFGKKKRKILNLTKEISDLNAKLNKKDLADSDLEMKLSSKDSYIKELESKNNLLNSQTILFYQMYFLLITLRY